MSGASPPLSFSLQYFVKPSQNSFSFLDITQMIWLQKLVHPFCCSLSLALALAISLCHGMGCYPQKCLHNVYNNFCLTIWRIFTLFVCFLCACFPLSLSHTQKLEKHLTSSWLCLNCYANRASFRLIRHSGDPMQLKDLFFNLFKQKVLEIILNINNKSYFQHWKTFLAA